MPFTAWQSFYVIVGSSGAALTGLVFVVVTLSAENKALIGSAATSAYATPTVVHFCAVLLVSAILSAPWPGLFAPAVALGGCGVAGIAYVLFVIVVSRRQTVYQPVMEDWIWYTVFPIVAYAILLASAAELLRYPTRSLFAIASASLILLFTGIHNAWDSVIYIAFTKRDTSGSQE